MERDGPNSEWINQEEPYYFHDLLYQQGSNPTIPPMSYRPDLEVVQHHPLDATYSDLTFNPRHSLADESDAFYAGNNTLSPRLPSISFQVDEKDSQEYGIRPGNYGQYAQQSIKQENPRMNNQIEEMNHVSGVYKKERKPNAKRGSKHSRTCKFANCTKSIQKFGLCHKHGGKRFCQVEGCTKKDRGEGYCVTHGGGKRCSLPDCTRVVRRGQLCAAHTTRRASTSMLPSSSKAVPKKGKAVRKGSLEPQISTIKTEDNNQFY